MPPHDPLTRRGFIRTTTMAAIGGAMAVADPDHVFARPPAKSKVVLIRDKAVLGSSGRVRADIVQSMLDTAVTTLTGAKDPAAAWRTLVGPDDAVGVKSNAWTYLPTTPEHVTAIQTRLLEAGVMRGNIAVDDRGVLRNALFRRATALINTRPKRTHHWSGVGSLIKNYIMLGLPVIGIDSIVASSIMSVHKLNFT